MGRLACGQVMSLMFIIPGLWLLYNNVSTSNVSILFYYSLLKLVVLFNVDLEMPSTAVSLSLLLFWLLLLGYVLNRNSNLVKTTDEFVSYQKVPHCAHYWAFPLLTDGTLCCRLRLFLSSIMLLAQRLTLISRC